MNLKFANGVTEFKDGAYYRKDDGQPFDVDERVGKDLIKTGCFEEVKAVVEPKKTEKKEKK